MKIALGIGVLCRMAGVPLPAPRQVGALLVVAMTLGFLAADAVLAAPLTARRAIVAVLSALWLAGCAVGAERLASSRLAYNQAVQHTEQQELLLNLVRLHHLEPPEFLALGGISTQLELDAALGFGAELGEDGDARLAIARPQARVGFAERPTVTLTPRRTRDFARQLLAPVGAETLYRLVEHGWGLERVLAMTVRRANGLGPGMGTAREARAGSETERLRELFAALGALHWRGALALHLAPALREVASMPDTAAPRLPALVEADAAGYALRPAPEGGLRLLRRAESLRIAVTEAGRASAEWRTVARGFGLARQRRVFDLEIDATAAASDTALRLATRSPLAVMGASRRRRRRAGRGTPGAAAADCARRAAAARSGPDRALPRALVRAARR